MRKAFLVLLVLFLVSDAVQAQSTGSGKWIWMRGDSTGLNSHYGIKGVADMLNEPPGRYEAGHWIDLQGTLWIYGGVNFRDSNGTAPLFNDLWKYDVAANKWTWVHGYQIGQNQQAVYGTKGIPSTLNNPPPLGFGFETWTDNQGNLWLYGGAIRENSANISGSNQLWRYRIATDDWTWMNGDTVGYLPPRFGIKGVGSPLNKPPSVREIKSAWIDSLGNLWQFGGSAENLTFNYLQYNCLWKYDIATNIWTWMHGDSTANGLGNYGAPGIAAPANDPPARNAWAKWQDNEGNFYLYGGYRIANPGSGVDTLFRDIWIYNTQDNTWKWASGPKWNDTGSRQTAVCQRVGDYPGNSFESICFPAAFGYYTNKFWFLAGGNSSDVTNTNAATLWCLKKETLQWTWVSGGQNKSYHFGTRGIYNPANLPPARFGSPFWLDHQDRLWVFGGGSLITSTSALTGTNDLWLYIPDTTCCRFPNTGAPSPVATIFPAPADTLLCYGGRAVWHVPSTHLITTILPGDGTYSYPDTGTVYFYPAATTAYSVIYFNGVRQDTLRFTIHVFHPQAAFSFQPSPPATTADVITLSNASSGADSYTWKLNGDFYSNEQSPTVNFPVAGNYCITLIAGSNRIPDCKDSVTHCLDVIREEDGYLVVPDAFTADNNGLNDRIKPLFTSNYIIEQFSIYNRYGQRLYTWDKKGWDGSYNGRAANIGVYHYYLKALHKGIRKTELVEKKGTITLLR